MSNNDWITGAFGTATLALLGWALSEIYDHGKILVHAEDELKTLSDLVTNPQDGIQHKVDWLYRNRYIPPPPVKPNP